MGTGFNLINKPLVGVNIIETTKKQGYQHMINMGSEKVKDKLKYEWENIYY